MVERNGRKTANHSQSSKASREISPGRSESGFPNGLEGADGHGLRDREKRGGSRRFLQKRLQGGTDGIGGIASDDQDLLEIRETRFVQGFPIPFDALLDVAQAWVAGEQDNSLMAKGNQMPRSFPARRSIVRGNAVEIGVASHAIQKNRGDSPLSQLVEDWRVVAAGDDDESVDVPLNECTHPVALRRKVFLGIRKDDLIVGKGGPLFDTSNDSVEQPDGNVRARRRRWSASAALAGFWQSDWADNRALAIASCTRFWRSGRT